MLICLWDSCGFLLSFLVFLNHINHMVESISLILSILQVCEDVKRSNTVSSTVQGLLLPYSAHMTTTGDSKHTLYTHYTHTLQSTPSTVAGRPPFTNRAQHNSFKHNYNTCMENPFGPYLFLAVGPTPDSDRQATGLNVSVRLETKLSGLCSSGWMSVKAVRPLLPV